MHPTSVSALNPFTGSDLATLLELRATQRAAHPFLIWCPFEGPSSTWSYARFAEDVARVAGGLAARGVKPGERVLTWLENSPECLIMLFACARLGAVHVPVNAMAAGPELAWFAEFTGAVGAVTQPRLFATLAAHCPKLKWLAVTSHDGGAVPTTGTPPDEASSFASLLGTPLTQRTPDPMAPALIMFTSGTTSRPKGVLWTHANVLWGARVGAMHQALRPDDIYQIFLPLFHVVGLSWSFLSAFWAGATVVLQPRFSASRYWPTALEQGATVGTQVIYTARVLSQQPVPAEHRFRQWLDAQCLPEFESHFGVKIIGAWGMTEMIAQGIIGDPWGPQRPRSIGRASPAYRLRIVDDDGRPVEPGNSGHLLVQGVRGVSVFAEYFDNPAATAEAFDEQGYFRTGDRVILHQDGFIEFSERAKDLIKVGGEGVAPAEVERVILELPGIKDAAVVARADPDYGEVPVAFIVLSGGHDTVATSEARVIEHCRASLAKFKVPREAIVIPELPRINFGKVAKVKLREWAKNPQDIPGYNRGEKR